MQVDKNDPELLRLDNQLCFALYACSREIIKVYKPILDPLNLTYTEYVVLMALWEKDKIPVKDLGQKIFLDSGTLTPLLKKLEAKGYVKRTRETSDERCLSVCLTDEGELLQSKAKSIPKSMASCVNLSPDEAKTLYNTLYKILGSFKDNA